MYVVQVYIHLGALRFKSIYVYIGIQSINIYVNYLANSIHPRVLHATYKGIPMACFSYRAKSYSNFRTKLTINQSKNVEWKCKKRYIQSRL